jgi:glycosyltransferase involved in cell wall biosynthesis
MYNNKSICVVVPARNEETQIETVLKTMPVYVDAIVVVDDASTDNTVGIVKRISAHDDRITLLEHQQNQGVGGAISAGYKFSLAKGFNVTAVMAGDGQMDPDDLSSIILPIVNDEADYTKGNRLFYGDAWRMIPRHRYLGNSFLSLFTKAASGYWHIADSQSGYTAISLIALKRLNLDDIYKDYGMPNDMLIKLNMYDFRVRDIHIRPVYHVGEKSGIKLARVIPRISYLLVKGFCKRLVFKYVIKDFHPLVFFYILSFILLFSSVPLIIRLIYIWATTGDIPDMNALLLVFTLISGFQTLFFSMWFDMEQNKDLK